MGILTVGVWAWSEKDTFNNLTKVANVALDPAFILICIGKLIISFIYFQYLLYIFPGTVTFIIGFTGCVGALRENTCLLATVCFTTYYNLKSFKYFSFSMQYFSLFYYYLK